MKHSTLLLLTFLTLRFATAQTPLTQQTYEGMINNKFAITLALTSDGNLMYGTLTYKKTGQPIKVVGSLEKDNALLHEFDVKGNVTGTYFGSITNGVFAGSWSSPRGKDMPFLVKKTAQNSVNRARFDVSGTYAYDFGKDNGSGKVTVKVLPKGNIAVTMDAVTGGPAYNMALIEKATLKLADNVAVYSNNEFGKCKLQLTFFDGGVSIIYLDEAYECGFGNAASVVGNYLKVGK
jgi:hypothetical protein